jgi:hypothetical protein
LRNAAASQLYGHVPVPEHVFHVEHDPRSDRFSHVAGIEVGRHAHYNVGARGAGKINSLAHGGCPAKRFFCCFGDHRFSRCKSIAIGLEKAAFEKFNAIGFTEVVVDIIRLNADSLGGVASFWIHQYVIEGSVRNFEADRSVLYACQLKQS